MQVRRQQSEEGGFGKPLPKALQNSPYAAGVMAPGLHKKIARGKASDKTTASGHQRQPRLSRGERSDVGHPSNHHVANELFAPPSNQREVISLKYIILYIFNIILFFSLTLFPTVPPSLS
jgi:hypothetical protein